ncbi:hypothetical protein LINPERHAP1_LOCUS17245, partial [Linum perenne]
MTYSNPSFLRFPRIRLIPLQSFVFDSSSNSISSIRKERFDCFLLWSLDYYSTGSWRRLLVQVLFNL